MKSLMSSGRRSSIGGQIGYRNQQLSSFILFLSVILFVNLCPFQQDFDEHHCDDSGAKQTSTELAIEKVRGLNSFAEDCLRFVKLMFTNPIRLGKRATRFTQADAAMLGKMAKVWYIKKKIKKLGKKLKKHTIAVPVFTAIPIYEHSYYPQQPHVAHLGHHHGGHHAAAASSFTPTYLAAHGATSSPGGSGVAAQLSPIQLSGHLATSASSTHQQTGPSYRMSPAAAQHSLPHHQGAAMFQAHMRPNLHPAHNQIINSYAPSPPLYVDEAGGLYGHYGNAYGRYDGGYQLW